MKALLSRLSQHFPDTVTIRRDAPPLLIVDLPTFYPMMRYLHDEERLNFLSSVTAVDWESRGEIEVVYHLSSLPDARDAHLEIRVSLPRDYPEIPSVTSLWPGAEWQEREVFDLMGVRFTGHPDLRRILLWDGFPGHPLRKDFVAEWPLDTDELVAVTHATPEQLPVAPPANPVEDSSGLVTETITLNMGPHHPSTHGVFRMVLTLNGEQVVQLVPVLGYLHRGIEKWAEARTYLQCVPITDRLDYICSMSNNFAYAVAVERLAGIEVPERAEYIRVIMAELTRVMNHLVAIGFYLNDLGCFFTPVLYCLRERERILDLFEMASGSRMTCNYIRFGGVRDDPPPRFFEETRALVRALPGFLNELEDLLSTNEILVARTQGVGVLTAGHAIARSATGPVLRASGVRYDVRKAIPYSVYDRFDFEVPVRTEGDSYARFLIRIDEIRQSLRILEQALEQIPEGPVNTKVPRNLRPPEGAVYSAIESPKGELGFYLVSDGSINPYRWHVRAPTFVNLQVLPDLAKGGTIQDVLAIFGSIDTVMAEVDR